MQLTGSPNPPTNGDPTLAEQASSAASHLKEKVSDLGQSAVTKIDESRVSAAGGLESAASAVTGAAHSTADKLTSTAEYLRGHDVKAMMTDVEHLVRKNPGPSLVAAAAVGFLTARAFRRSD